MKNKYFFRFSFSFLIFLCGCSSRIHPHTDYIPAYQQGNFTYSEERLTQAIEKKHIAQDYRKSKDAVWLLLDRATVQFAQGNTDLAIQDYLLALEAIDFYSQISTSEKISQVVVSDDVEAYAGEDFEQILARVYLALALLQDGDTGNAFAMLQQAEDVQQKKLEEYKNTAYTSHYNLVGNNLAKYLLALISEKRGDYSNARILYEQSIHYPESTDKRLATVLIISHHGCAPYKISGICPVSQISMAALEVFLSSGSGKLEPALCSLTGIPVPILCQGVYSEAYPLQAALDGQKKSLEPIYDITAVAYAQMNQKLPVIAARGAARLLLRRAAVGYAQEQDPNFGAIMDLAMLAANLNTSADTRSWSTLPARLDFARYDVQPGKHLLEIQLSCTYLNLKPNDLCVINVFNIRPGTVSIQIPKQFINN